MFPCVIAALPPLPPELQYRIVGNTLVLIDVHISLIVDLLRGALAEMTVFDVSPRDFSLGPENPPVRAINAEGMSRVARRLAGTDVAFEGPVTRNLEPEREPIMTPDIKRILVPLDFSANSARALDYACGLAQKFDAAIHLIHVCEVPSMMTASMDAYAIAYTDWSQRLGAEAEVQLNREAARVAGVKVTTEVLFGNAAKGIVDAADATGADLIVMGTHGHGAVMHVVMGNVAERVVRTAPCPVLTVREPREREGKKGHGKLAGAGAVIIAAMLMLPSAASAQEPVKQTTPGGETFRTYCATCHGTSARGDGPLASSMRRKPSNLTEIAKRNGGVFPSEMVSKVIDGRQPVRGHGGPDMPAWGDAFSRSREAGDEERIQSVIKALVDYLDSIQLRPAHEQQQ